MEKKYDHHLHEARLKEHWEQEKIYTLNAHEVDKEPLFSIDTPPPTVSGSLHIGHIFSYTHTDLIARYKRMSGNAVFYPFGFDDNGLPTERFVEKKEGKSALSMGRSAFIALCLKETAIVEQKFQDLWQTIGLSIDWNSCYSTIDERTRRISQKSFIELFHNKHVYRKQEPALYCTTCYTSVAQAELDDAEKPSIFYTLTFTTTDNEPLSIATTRPEFLASCVAVMYNPQDTRYQHLRGKKIRVPLYGQEVPCIADELVKIDKGTGLVMCCAFGDTTDIEWIKKYNLSYPPLLQKDGRFAAEIAYIGGLKVKPAREAVVKALQESMIITAQKEIVHSVNIHERCKQEIEFLSLAQWFVAIKSHKQVFLNAAEKINWHPSYMKTRYDNWVEHINWDWCISRQRFFGIPFPCWHCTACGTVLLADESQLPVDPQETPYGKPCPNCGSSDIIPDMDVMDTWNTSSLTPYICREIFSKAYPQADAASNFMPMSMRPQAHDIIRTWAFDTIVKTSLHDSIIPWKDIVISGHVLSTEKQKISKSQGNSPLEPENLLKTYSADVIRYWTACAHLGTDTAFSENQLKIGQRLQVKLWNAFLFIKEHGIPSTKKDHSDVVNQWIMHRATETFNAYQHAFDHFEFHKALEVIENFFWHDFCDNYLELTKDQFFNPDAYDAAKRTETQAVLYAVGLQLLQWYAPYMPFITDVIYQELYLRDIKKESLHTTQYVSPDYVAAYPAALETVALLLQAVNQVRKLKSDANLSLKTELARMTIYCSPAQEKQLSAVHQLLAGISKARVIVYAQTPHKITSLVQEHENYAAEVAL